MKKLDIHNSQNGIEITPEMVNQNVIEPDVNEKSHEHNLTKLQMKFEEALSNLRNGKILTRQNWQGRRLTFKNNNFNITTQITSTNSTEAWNPSQEDISAVDWELINPEDIKEFTLSANELKSFGVSDEDISKLRNKTSEWLKEFTSLNNVKLLDSSNVDMQKIYDYTNNSLIDNFQFRTTSMPDFTRK